jgi:uncharacterized membrane protein YagU involved in acid resistance
MMQNEVLPKEEGEQPKGETTATVWPPEIYPYHAGIVGGFIGGVGMAGIGTIAGIVLGYGPWYPVNLLAAAAIASFQSMSPEQLSQFSLSGLFVGTVLHFTISVAIGLLVSLLLPMFPGHPVGWSLIAGAILWVFADIVLLPLLNPRMAALVDVPSFIIAHLAYTLLLGLTVDKYKKIPVQSALPSEVYPYHAGITGGILGGIAMAAIGIITGVLIGRGPWYPVNLLAATAIRSFQTMSPEQLSEFNLSGLFVGTILHFTIAIAIGLLFAFLLPMLPGHPLIWSLIAGGVLWISADVVFLLPLNPIMSRLVNVPSFIIAHLVYTVILGLWVSRYEKVPIIHS